MNSAAIAVPYCGSAPTPSELWMRWNFDPALLAIMAAVAIGWALLSNARPREHAMFAAGFVFLLIAFVSPLCALSSALFSARAAHHLVIVAAAAPLLALALPWRAHRLPLGLSTAIHALVFWLWHAPPLYAWALASDFAYWLMQITLLGSALAFWGAALGGRAPSVAVALMAMIAQMGMLGALITFAPQPLYTPHLGVTLSFGLSALEDQQIAGLIMWAPASAIYLLTAMVLLYRWIGRDDEARADLA